MDNWQFAILLFVTVIGLGAILFVLGQVKTEISNLVRAIQWGSPRITERRPPVPAAHRKED